MELRYTLSLDDYVNLNKYSPQKKKNDLKIFFIISLIDHLCIKWFPKVFFSKMVLFVYILNFKNKLWLIENMLVHATYGYHKLLNFLFIKLPVFLMFIEFSILKQYPDAIKNMAIWNKYIKWVNGA